MAEKGKVHLLSGRMCCSSFCTPAAVSHAITIIACTCQLLKLILFFINHFLGKENGGAISSESCPSKAREEGKILWFASKIITLFVVLFVCLSVMEMRDIYSVLGKV